MRLGASVLQAVGLLLLIIGLICTFTNGLISFMLGIVVSVTLMIIGGLLIVGGYYKMKKKK